MEATRNGGRATRRQRVERPRLVERQRVERQRVERQRVERQRVERQRVERQRGERPRRVERQRVERQRVERPRLRLRRARAMQLATWLAMQAAGRASVRAGGWFAARLWFTPWPVQGGEAATRREAAWLAGTRPVELPIGAKRSLAGFVAGDGPTVLLVHGWGDRASRLGAFVQPLVAAGHRVVGVDLPAHGDNEGGETNLYELAEAVRAVADHLGGVHAVVAHSLGGAAVTLALGRGLEARSVVLVAPPVRLDHALARFAGMLRVPRRAAAGLRATLERRFGDGIWRETAGDEVARGLETPALIVHDRDDPQIAFADAQALAAAWPGARLVATEGLGHSRILRDEAVVEQAVAFLARDRVPG